MNHIPGTLIFDLKGKLVYFNEEALNYLPRLKERRGDSQLPSNLPNEVLYLFKTTRENMKGGAVSNGKADAEHTFIYEEDRQLFLRSFPIGHLNGDLLEKFILLLIEPADQGSLIDLPRAARVYRLSKREIEVIQMICRGKSNKEISELLFISEQTVKDHVKNIMRKVKVNSRTKIMAALLNLPKISLKKQTLPSWGQADPVQEKQLLP
jgi:DNA-binding CsgD family transcriptional regulator